MSFFFKKKKKKLQTQYEINSNSVVKTNKPESNIHSFTSDLKTKWEKLILLDLNDDPDQFKKGYCSFAKQFLKEYCNWKPEPRVVNEKMNENEWNDLIKENQLLPKRLIFDSVKVLSNFTKEIHETHLQLKNIETQEQQFGVENLGNYSSILCLDVMEIILRSDQQKFFVSNYRFEDLLINLIQSDYYYFKIITNLIFNEEKIKKATQFAKEKPICIELDEVESFLLLLQFIILEKVLDLFTSYHEFVSTVDKRTRIVKTINLYFVEKVVSYLLILSELFEKINLTQFLFHPIISIFNFLDLCFQMELNLSKERIANCINCMEHLFLIPKTPKLLNFTLNIKLLDSRHFENVISNLTINDLKKKQFQNYCKAIREDEKKYFHFQCLFIFLKMIQFIQKNQIFNDNEILSYFHLISFFDFFEYYSINYQINDKDLKTIDEFKNNKFQKNLVSIQQMNKKENLEKLENSHLNETINITKEEFIIFQKLKLPISHDIKHLLEKDLMYIQSNSSKKNVDENEDESEIKNQNNNENQDNDNWNWHKKKKNSKKNKIQKNTNSNNNNNKNKNNNNKNKSNNNNNNNNTTTTTKTNLNKNNKQNKKELDILFPTLDPIIQTILELFNKIFFNNIENFKNIDINEESKPLPINLLLEFFELFSMNKKDKTSQYYSKLINPELLFNMLFLINNIQSEYLKYFEKIIWKILL
ncbi:hypothetical protein M0813_15509 [Anaeramoeba flamelloides]|uniref:Uncharacterized protein n=1 Tax=Anaeramoeba flamelloides TaxID=1746091 RepID=A0ABQ8Z1D5_9EUKA|nr:hypothetical protein M0813_15509 [Anaeramoeba flamelloides]